MAQAFPSGMRWPSGESVCGNHAHRHEDEVTGAPQGGHGRG